MKRVMDPKIIRRPFRLLRAKFSVQMLPFSKPKVLVNLITMRQLQD